VHGEQKNPEKVDLVSLILKTAEVKIIIVRFKVLIVHKHNSNHPQV
jgi:hypothetical protein